MPRRQGQWRGQERGVSRAQGGFIECGINTGLSIVDDLSSSDNASLCDGDTDKNRKVLAMERRQIETPMMLDLIAQKVF
jgi:hypothetical protein